MTTFNRAAIAQAGITDFRFLRSVPHVGIVASAGLHSCGELKELGGWKSRAMVDRYAKFGTEHLTVAAGRIERGVTET